MEKENGKLRVSAGKARDVQTEREGESKKERERAPDPVFDISPCSVDKGCHPLVLGALTAVCSHQPSPAQETIDQPDSTTLNCVCVSADMCVSSAVMGEDMQSGKKMTEFFFSSSSKS